MIKKNSYCSYVLLCCFFPPGILSFYFSLVSFLFARILSLLSLSLLFFLFLFIPVQIRTIIAQA